MLTTPISRDSPAPSRRALDPVDRVAEALFGLIMVLSFTGSLSVASTYGRLTGFRPVGMGISMVVLGAALLGITMALGG